jgi:hypothetical protein
LTAAIILCILGSVAKTLMKVLRRRRKKNANIRFFLFKIILFFLFLFITNCGGVTNSITGSSITGTEVKKLNTFKVQFYNHKKFSEITLNHIPEMTLRDVILYSDIDEFLFQDYLEFCSIIADGKKQDFPGAFFKDRRFQQEYSIQPNVQYILCFFNDCAFSMRKEEVLYLGSSNFSKIIDYSPDFSLGKILEMHNLNSQKGGKVVVLRINPENTKYSIAFQGDIPLEKSSFNFHLQVFDGIGIITPPYQSDKVLVFGEVSNPGLKDIFQESGLSKEEEGGLVISPNSNLYIGLFKV